MLENTTLRKVQANNRERSLLVTLAKDYTARLGIHKGDFLKCTIDGNRLVLEKADI